MVRVDKLSAVLLSAALLCCRAAPAPAPAPKHAPRDEVARAVPSWEGEYGAPSAKAVPWSTDEQSEEESSLQELFIASGFPDPRGLEYREIERVETTDALNRRVRGWFFEKNGRGYIISVQGAIFATTDKGKPADLAAHLERSLSPTSRQTFPFSGIHVTSVTWWLARRANPGVVAPLWRAYRKHVGSKPRPRDEIELWPLTLQRRLFDLFSARQDAEARDLAEQQAALLKKLGRWHAKHRKSPIPDDWKRFAEDIRRLVPDLDRRILRGPSSNVVNALKAPITPGEDLEPWVTLLDEEVDNVSEARNSVAQRIASHGRPGVLRLLEVLRDDERLTRIQNPTPTAITSVRRVAFHGIYNALESSHLQPPPFEALAATVEREPKAVAAVLRHTLSTSPLWHRRWIDVLRDDSAGRARWIDAADKLADRFRGHCSNRHCQTGNPPERGPKFTAHAAVVSALVTRAKSVAKRDPMAACRLTLARASHRHDPAGGAKLHNQLKATWNKLPVSKDTVRCRAGLVSELMRDGRDGALLSYASWFASAVEKAAPNAPFPFVSGIEALAPFAGNVNLAASFKRILAPNTQAAHWMARASTHAWPDLMRSAEFRAFVGRQLGDTRAVGVLEFDTHQLDYKLDGGAGWVMSDVFGAGKPTRSGKHRFRTCDIFARLIVLSSSGPPFSITWDLPARDAAIAKVKQYVSKKGIWNR